jgi:membrane protein implicated in regulation of membrane protease activity
MRNLAIAVLIFLAIVVIIMGLLYYFDIRALIALLVGFGVLVGVIVFAVVSGVVLILAVPYYLAAKKPKIEKFGNYKLEDAKGKEDDAKKNGERKV